MKKKLTISLAIIMTLGIILTGCGKKQQTKDTFTEIKDKGIITIGLSDRYPPFEYRNEKNELMGFDIDLANAIGEKINTKVEIVNIPFKGIVQGLKSNKFDAILSGFSITEKRKEEVLFSDSYLNGGQYVLVNSNNTSINTIDDLKSQTLGVAMATTSAEAAKKIKDVKEVKEYDTTAEALMDLENDRINAVVIDKPVCDYYIQKKKDSYKKIDATIQEEPMGLAFRKEDKSLKSEIDKALKSLKEEGKLSELSQKWFQYDAYK